MALNKQPLSINFKQGLETKTDPYQIPIGKFSALQNSVFDTEARLTKRNGFGALTPLSDTATTFLTTFNGGLTAVGNTLQALSQGSDTWVNKGTIQPLSLDVLPLIRNTTNQSQCDSVVSSNGLICTVYTDNVPSMSSTVPVYKYVIADVATGQNVVAPVAIPVGSGAISGSPRVFLLGNYFIIVFSNTITAVEHLQYIAINVVIPTSVTANTNLTSAYTSASGVNWDGYVANNKLFLAWNANTGGGAIKLTTLSSNLSQGSVITFAGKAADLMSVTADESGNSPIIWVSFYAAAGPTAYVLAVDQSLNTILAPTLILAAGVVHNITSTAQNNAVTVYYEISQNYSYNSVASNYITSKHITNAGVITGPTVVARSVGLASKAFLIGTQAYMLAAYSSTFQPTYFLLKSNGDVISKLAYSNGGGYLTKGLPGVTITDTVVQVPYLIKDLISAVNKTQGVTNAAGVYSQTGINLATFDIGHGVKVAAEIGSNLHLTGGFMWMYDGYTPVEHGFHLWPDNVFLSTATTGGFLTDQLYYYVATYEWADNQGNVFRSAPSIPVAQTTTGGNVSANTIDIPTLRLTYKISNPVKICLYRWSTAQQTYYQITSLTVPLLNDTTVDSVSYIDTLADSSIIGNNILYTTGGVLENIAAPAIQTVTLWQSRLVYLYAEDRNLLGISKLVIEGTPVETSDQLTLYVAPTIGSQGPTGPLETLAVMDEKLIVFKDNAIYYFNGQGPDSTGANSQISEPVFITATVGCSNQSSIVFMPNGLMFQSDKGIWLLGRDLSTSYIGSPVEALTTNATVLSAVSVPGTNQIRFTMDTGITLMYDYIYGQWGSFVNIPAISSTLYQGLHTYVNIRGQVYQETVGQYLDGSNPVLVSFTTGWINLAGLQGYQRAYELYFLGTYVSPHKLQVQIGYDYNPSATQSTTITPDNYSGNWGDEQLWGSGDAWGGPGNIEQWRIFFDQQKCEAFRISINEVFDASFGTVAGAGLTMSGLNLTVGVKSGQPKLRASRQAG